MLIDDGGDVVVPLMTACSDGVPFDDGGDGVPLDDGGDGVFLDDGGDGVHIDEDRIFHDKGSKSVGDGQGKLPADGLG